MQPQLTLFVIAPFEKPSLFISTKIVEGAANDEIASADALPVDMEVVFVRTDIVVAACPKNVAGGVDDSALTSVVRPHENIETGRELQLQRGSRIKAPEAARVDFGNVHRRLPACFSYPAALLARAAISAQRSMSVSKGSASSRRRPSSTMRA